MNKVVCPVLIALLLVVSCEDEIPPIEQEEFVYSFDCCTDSLHFYYFNDLPRSLELSTRCITIKVRDRRSREFLHYLTEKYDVIDTVTYYIEEGDIASAYLVKDTKCEEIETLLQNLYSEYQILWALPTYQDSSLCVPWIKDECELKRLTDIITLKLKDDVPSFVFDSLLSLTNVKLIAGPLKDVWYEISVDKFSVLNSLDMSRYLFETGYFELADPHFMIDWSDF